MMVSLLGVFSKHVLNHEKSKKKRNSRETPGNLQRTAAESVKLAADLNRIVLRLYGQFLSEDGKHVNYDALGASPLFAEYREQCEQLITIDLGALSLAEKKAFCLNIYNTLLIHAFVDIGAPHNSASRLKFFTTAAYDIGGHVYSLNDIEHGILRGNSKHMGKRPFADNDERLQFALKPSEVDPRVHFGLVCGAKSCPPIRVFTPENLDNALTLAARAFCEDNVEIDTAEQWYEEDFGVNLFGYIRQFLSDEKRSKLDTAVAEHYTVLHADYSWEVNK